MSENPVRNTLLRDNVDCLDNSSITFGMGISMTCSAVRCCTRSGGTNVTISSTWAICMMIRSRDALLVNDLNFHKFFHDLLHGNLEHLLHGALLNPPLRDHNFSSPEVFKRGAG